MSTTQNPQTQPSLMMPLVVVGVILLVAFVAFFFLLRGGPTVATHAAPSAPRTQGANQGFPANSGTGRSAEDEQKLNDAAQMRAQAEDLRLKKKELEDRLEKWKKVRDARDAKKAADAVKLAAEAAKQAATGRGEHPATPPGVNPPPSNPPADGTVPPPAVVPTPADGGTPKDDEKK